MEKKKKKKPSTCCQIAIRSFGGWDGALEGRLSSEVGGVEREEARAVFTHPHTLTPTRHAENLQCASGGSAHPKGPDAGSPRQWPPSGLP